VVSDVIDAIANVAAQAKVSFSEVLPDKFIARQVCLAGAPLFEGRWIPVAGEIIPSGLLTG